jgi:hypothetical protein
VAVKRGCRNSSPLVGEVRACPVHGEPFRVNPYLIRGEGVKIIPLSVYGEGERGGEVGEVKQKEGGFCTPLLNK